MQGRCGRASPICMCESKYNVGERDSEREKEREKEREREGGREEENT